MAVAGTLIMSILAMYKYPVVVVLKAIFELLGQGHVSRI
jgi:hypothetical protein